MAWQEITDNAVIQNVCQKEERESSAGLPA